MGSPPALPAAILPALPLTGSELLRVHQGSGWFYATAAQIAALTPDSSAAVSTLAAQLAATNASVVALAQRTAALEGKPDPCVALSGTIPVATVQIGTVTMAVPVAGLLATDRVSVEPSADLPAGLVLAWAHPSSNGVLTVALTAGAIVVIKAPVTLNVTALR